MKSFLYEWLIITILSCLFFGAIAIIITPIIIASNFIENNHFAVVFSLIWELLSIPFLITIAIRIVRKSREKQ